MAAKTVGFAVAQEDTATLDALVDHFAGGNRSEFLRVAMRRMSRDLKAERMREIQAGFRAEMNGKVATREEVLALIDRH